MRIFIGIRSTRTGSRRRRFGLAAALAALATGCSPLGALDTLLASEDGYRAEIGRAYGALDRQKLDVYRPDTPAAGTRPAVIFFYGGSWRNGERGHYRFVGQALAQRGVVAIIPDYRLYPEVQFPTFLSDAAKAIRWAVDNAARLGIDPARIHLAGHSAGAHIAATLALDGRYLGAAGLQPQAIASVIGISGPYGFDPAAYRSTRPVFESAAEDTLIRPTAMVERLDGDASRPAFTLLHGASDTTVLPKNSAALADSLRKAGRPVSNVTYPEIGHYRIILAFFEPFRGWAPVLDDMVAALRSEHEAAVNLSGSWHTRP